MNDQPLRLLFVEDVPADMELAERALRKEGMVFDSMCVDTAEALITALDEFKPDIVISDYSMPEFDGMSALKISLERDILLPFIVLTGAQNEEIAVACMKSGATDYVLKERLARLPFAVKEALEQKQVRAAKEAAERALRESEESYRNIFNGVQDAIFVETLDGRRILAVNDRACEMYGYPRAELLTKSVSDLVPEGQPVLTSASKEVSSVPMQTVNLRSNGERFPIEITGRMEKINGEKLLLVIVRDVTERKRTEEELLKLRKAVDSSREVIFMTDPNGLITFINPEFSRLYGYTAAEVVGKATPRILKSGNMKPSDYENFWKTILNRQVAQSELINKTKDGRLLTIEGSVTPVLDERGDISAFLAIQRDVTERKRAEEALRESEAMLTKAQGIGHMGNWKWNVATNETIWSEEVYRLYGLNPEKDKPDYSVVIDTLTPEFKDDFLKAVEDALNNRKPFEGEYSIIRPDGTRRYTYTKGEVSRDKEGNPTGMFGIVQDITERKQAEEKLRQSEEQNRRLIDVMPSGVVVHSEGRIVLANQVAVKAFGAKDSEQLIGTMLIDRVHPNYRNIVVARVQSAIGKGTQANLIEEKLLRLDGSAFDVEVTAIPITYEGKTSVLALFNDISERKKAEEELRKGEESYTGLFNTVTEAIYIQNPDGAFLNVNEGAVKMYGYTREEMIGKTPEFVSAPGKNDLAHIFSLVQRVFATGKPEAFEFWGQRKNGEVFPKDCISNKGKYFGMDVVITTARDVTERKRAEERLLQSEEQYRTLFNHLPIPVFTKDINGVYTSCNEESLRYWVTNPIGYTDAEVFPNEIAAALQANDQLVIKSGEVVTAEELLQNTPMGDHLFISRKVPLHDSSGNIVGILGASLDITDRKQAEQALQQRARELQTLYEISLETSAQTSLDKLLSSIVKQASSLLGTNGGGLYMMEPDGQSLKLVVVHNLPQEYINVTLKLGEGLSGQVAQSGKPIIVEDYQNWSGRAGVFNGTPFRRVLGIPLTAKNRVIGVINVSDFTNTGSFSDDEVRLVSLFADQAALAIESARLHEQEHTRNRELATLYESAMAISSDLSLEVVLKTVVEQVTRAINTAGCTLSFLDRERDTLVTMVDHRTDSTDTADTPGTTYSLKDFPATRRVLETRQPLFESRRDPQIDPAELALMEKLGMSTELLLPLVTRDQVIGLMELYEVESKERVFTEDEIRLAQSLSVQTAIFIDNARLFEHAERRLQQTEALHTIDMAIASSMDVNFIFSVIFGQMISQLGVDAAVVLLYNPVTQVLEYAAGRGFRTDALRYTRLRLGDGYAGRAALERQMIHIPDLHGRKTDFLRSPTFSQEGFVSYFGMPLIAKGELKGVLEVFHRSAFDAGTEWLNFLETLAGQVAIAIDNAQLFENLQRSNFELTLSYDATIEGWSRAMELRDEETEGHTQRVTTLTLELARQMGVPETELIHIRRGALLHDIGKIGIPDSILLKSDMLTNEEQTIMRRHPTYAYEMLTPIPYLRPALDIPYSHHEKWDGTGYPQGLKGGQIPLPARIFAIVDVWDALTSNRPYRPAWTKEKAIEYIKEQSGKHFDPKVTAAFLQKVVDNDI